jgi:nucleolar protein 15
MGGHGGAKKKVKAAVVTATKTVTVAPAKPLRPKRAAPAPADEAARPAKKQAKLPEHVPVGKEEPSKSESARPVVNRKAMEAAKTKQLKGERFGLGKPAGPGGAVVYLGHIPHGFYEEQMKGFFTQFGTVSRLRLARNRKTGRSKHFAFIEFEHREVAEVVAKAMNGYLLYSKILECRLLKPEEVRPKTFNVSKANLQLVNRPIDQLRNTERSLFNAERSVEKQQKLAGRRAGAARQRGRQWAKVGIEYEFEGVSGEATESDPSKKKPKAAKAAVKVAGKAAAKAAAKPKGKAAAKPKTAAKPKAAAQEPPASASKTAGVKRAAPSPGAQKAVSAAPRSGTPAKAAKRAKAA